MIMFWRKICLLIVAVLVMGAYPPARYSVGSIAESIMALHDGRFFIWHECGKQLSREDGVKRAREYAEMIQYAIRDSRDETGEVVDPDYVVAVLFRESSHDECVIGKQEIERLATSLGRTPKKKDLIAHVSRWTDANNEALRWCRINKGDKKGRSNCARRRMEKRYPEYKHIQGWDIGAGQYRWPGTRTLRKRQVILPGGGMVSGMSVKKLFDYRVSIKLMVEDLALYRGVCREHEHYNVSKRGNKTLIASEDAYFAHHHTGGGSWSLDYWKRVRRHLKVIKSEKSSSLLAFMKIPFRFNRL